MLEPDELDNSAVEKFLCLKSLNEARTFFELNKRQFDFYYRSNSPDRYTHFEVAKRGKKASRVIHAPVQGLRLLQQTLNVLLQRVYKRKPSVHGFVLGQSIKSNAEPHLRRRLVLNVDLLDFFPSINFGRVRGVFLSYPFSFPEEVATFLARLTTVDNMLPQGAPSSPVISNFICRGMDSEFQTLAKKCKCRYTRYCDDLTFSTTLKELPVALCEVEVGDSPRRLMLSGPVRRLAEKHGFKINDEKTTLRNRSSRQEVVGLVVNRKLNVPREFVRQIRSMIYSWDTEGYEIAEKRHLAEFNLEHRRNEPGPRHFEQVLRGKLAHLAFVKGKSDPVVRKYRNRFLNLADGYKAEPDNESTVYVLEGQTGEDLHGGSAFFIHGIGFVSCAHVVCKTQWIFRCSAPEKRNSIDEILYKDDVLDVAVFESLIPKYRTLRLGDSSTLKVGEEVVLCGFPNYAKGHPLSPFAARVVAFQSNQNAPMVLIDKPIIHGMSGGPVLDQFGDVVGIVMRGSDSLMTAQVTNVHSFLPINRFRESWEARRVTGV